MITNTEMRDLVRSQKNHELTYILEKKYIEREVDPVSWDNDLIKVMIGPRRAGKSHFLIHQLSQLGNFSYINFDTMALTNITNYEEMLSILDDVYGHAVFYMFDEIQNVPNWEDLVSFLQRRGLKVVLTGSNAKLLSKEFATKLTGRHEQITLFPFSFSEHLTAHEMAVKSMTTSEIQAALEIYLVDGGFPEIVLGGVDKHDYLKDLFDAILYKDIRARFDIRKPRLLEDFAYHLISNIASEFSYQKMGNRLGCGADVLVSYFSYLEEAFVFFSIPRWSEKASAQVIYNKKAYCIDNGFITEKGFHVLGNEEVLYENLVAIILHKDELQGHARVFFWRNQAGWEVDFVVKQGMHVVHLIQVTFDIKAPSTRERESRALIKASEALGCDDLVIINRDIESTEPCTWQGVTKTISFIPLWRWLLEKDHKNQR
ncbi:MAG TPA: ATP-binding protein [Candidatus Lokiarchaeia archaeon]|nr:ATP-binding protein [Candidatus Lokiarchaeia archaeon]